MNSGQELLHIEGYALDLAGFGEEAHDMAVPKKELVPNAVLGERYVVGGDQVVKPVEGRVTVPRASQRVPLRLCAHATDMECAMQEDESVGFGQDLLKGRRE